MVNRKIAFGYERRNGTVQPCPPEAKVVQMMHTEYANGASFIKITAMLNAGSIPYHEPDKPWNKNMVARIIGNKIYTGTSGYPRLIDDTLFQQVVDRKPAMGYTKDPEAKLIRALCRCAACGRKVSLHTSSKKWERWHCPHCGLLTGNATTKDVKMDLEKIITGLKSRSDIIRAQPDCSLQNETDSLERRLQDLMEQEQFDDALARRLVVELAQARLASIGSEDYETKRIQQLLELSLENGKSYTELLPKITSAILIPISGEVGLLLKNGQTIGRRDFEWQ